MSIKAIVRNVLPILPILAAAVPLLILFKMVSTALYALPETDDFCFAYHYNDDGLLRTVWIFYSSVIGRISAILLMTMPAIISKASQVDLFIVYPLLLCANGIGFVATCVFVAGRLWAVRSIFERILAGTALSATIFVLAVSLREMLYWAPGSFSYMIPGLIVMIVLVELVRSAANDTALSPLQTVVLSILCFLGALCNEFTPLWLAGFVVSSFLFRWLASHPYPQRGNHAAILAGALIGIAILLLAPGNAIRLGQYPAGQKFAESIIMGWKYTATDLGWLYQREALWGWLSFVALFSAFVAPARDKLSLRMAFLIVALSSLIFGCAYAGHFIGYFATGEDLATRARNEVVVLFIVGMTCIVALAMPMLKVRGDWLRAAAVVACGIACIPLLNGQAMTLLNSERSQFEMFWLESMQRHVLLSLTPDADVSVPVRTVKPSVLMAEDLTDNPGRLPNDCVAAFYRKKTVVMHPGT